MKEGQDRIYYVTADSFARRATARTSRFPQAGIEVLLLHDRVDEWVVSNLTEFEGKQLHSVAKGDLDLGGLADEEKKARAGGRRAEGGDRENAGRARRQGQGSAGDFPADRFARLPGQPMSTR
jgi:molecular chaperone HtpG